MKVETWILTAAVVLFQLGCQEHCPTVSTNPAETPYAITIYPSNFMPGDSITGNTYFPLLVGQTLTYRGLDEGDSVRVETVTTANIIIIQGVACRIVSDKAYQNGELIEDTFDWYAQDRNGNVWYFGEDTKQIENGVVIGTAGSWQSGVDGALAGIAMLANPIVGEWYRQEFYEGQAEDVAQILSLNDTLTVPFGTFSNCLVTSEYSPLEPDVEEHKIYAPGVGLLRAIGVKGESGFEDLISITQ